MRRGRVVGGLAAVLVVVCSAVASAAPVEAQAVPLPQVPPLTGNPTPLTDLVASTFRLGTGGTTRACATSGLGFTVYCVENVRVLPAASSTASGVTFGHWIYCKAACEGNLLVHELVHVAQFEEHGDLFGPAYLVEAGLHGTGCENKWEKPAYQTGGSCLDP